MGIQLFEHQDDLEWSDIYRYANSIGLDLERFRRGLCACTIRRWVHRVQDDAPGRRTDGPQLDTDVFRQRARTAQGAVGDAASLIRALEAGR